MKTILAFLCLTASAFAEIITIPLKITVSESEPKISDCKKVEYGELVHLTYTETYERTVGYYSAWRLLGFTVWKHVVHFDVFYYKYFVSEFDWFDYEEEPPECVNYPWLTKPNTI